MFRIHRDVLSSREGGASTLFAERVLISSVAPGLDLLPRLRRKKAIHLASGKHSGAAWFAVTISEVSQPGEQPHREERDRCPKNPARFGNKAAPARLENAIHFGNRLPPARQNREQTRRDENVERAVRMRKLEDVVALKPAVVQGKCIALLPGPTQLTRRSVYPEY